jgi:hypothetical protein
VQLAPDREIGRAVDHEAAVLTTVRFETREVRH